MRPRLTEHAVERYVSRVKPLLSRKQAREELVRLWDMAGEPVSHLDWHDPRNGDFPAFLVLSDGIALALKPDGPRAALTGVTVLTRGGSNPAHRENKNRKQAQRKAARRTRNRKGRRHSASRGRDRTPGSNWR